LPELSFLTVETDVKKRSLLVAAQSWYFRLRISP